MAGEFCSINSFLPAYPSVSVRDDNLFDLFPNGFYQSIYDKKEFNQLQIDPTKPRIRDGKFHPQPQQTYAGRYASSKTLYDCQMIIHSMGVGKTGLAVLTVENNLGKGFIGAVIAVPSKKFIDTFMSEIINITGDKYLPDKAENLTEDELRRAIRSRIKKVYKFITFEAFANSIEKDKNAGGNTADRLREEYSNRIIIVDEAHNLRIQPDKKAQTSRVNSAFNLLFHSVYNCKKLLMTGTPMKDRWNELPDLANLILPQEQQLPSGNAFDQKFPNDGKNIGNVDILKDRLKGMISTLKPIPSTVKKDFIGSFLPGLELFKVDISEMSDFQAKSYLEAYASDTLQDGGEDEKSKGIYNSSRQAINFVFPDGSYGSDGFKKYMVPLPKAAKRLKKGTKTFDIEPMNTELRQAIEGKTYEETLANLSKYSSKYAQTIRDILEQTKNQSGNSYIYNSYVDGSGSVLFARILELFGYRRSIKGVENTKGKRYVLLTNRTLDDSGKMVADMQKTINDPKNARGEYIQVVIGSRTSGEGLSFYNVENIGIHTPYWNYSTIDQAINRGLRFRSHDEIIKIFLEEKKDFSVKIHHYVAVPPNPNDSIDVIMYQKCQEKDIRIKLGERMLKQISYDCGNNKLINMQGVDGSRECEYLNCEYKCEGLSGETKLDYSSYNYYYSQEDEDAAVSRIKVYFRTKFLLTLIELKELLTDFHPFIVIKSLKKIVDQSIPIINMLGFRSYLREFNDIYFLVDSMSQPSSSLASYYTSAPAIKSVIPLEEYINDVQYQQSGFLLELMYREIQRGNYDLMSEYISRLPIDVKESLLESIIIAEDQKVPINREFRKWFLELNKAVVHRLTNGTIVSNLVDGNMMCYEGGVWKDCSNDEKIRTEIEETKVLNVKGLEDNPYGYYAIVNRELLGKGWKTGFWIRDMTKAKQQLGDDGRKKIRGAQCSTGDLKIGKLASMAYNFGLDLSNRKDDKKTIQEMINIINADKSKLFTNEEVSAMSPDNIKRFFRLIKGGGESLCRLLLKWFEDHNLVEETKLETMK